MSEDIGAHHKHLRRYWSFLIFCLLLSASPAAFAAKKSENCKSALIPDLSTLADEGRSVPSEWVDQLGSRPAHTGANRVLNHVVQSIGPYWAARNLELISRLNPFYSHALPQLHPLDQETSGRCWIFATLNMIRHSTLMIRQAYEINVRPEERQRFLDAIEPSATHLYFWDMFERTNIWLEEIIAHNKKDSKKQLPQVFATISDGGWFDWAKFLINKYGLVPRSRMPETANSVDSAHLINDLGQLMAPYAHRILQMKASHADTQQLRQLKYEALTAAYEFLVRYLGRATHPNEKFEFRIEHHNMDEEGALSRNSLRGRVTPLGFGKEIYSFDINDYVMVASFPKKEEGQTYQSDIRTSYGFTNDGRIKFLNVSMDRMMDMAKTVLKQGRPVWTAVDMRDYDLVSGIMHPDIVDHSELVTLPRGMQRPPELNRADRIRLGSGGLNHAVILTGVDVSQRGRPLKFKVENSWNPAYGDYAHFHMDASWFRENVYAIVVPISTLSDSEATSWVFPKTIRKESELLNIQNALGADRHPAEPPLSIATVEQLRTFLKHNK